MQMNNQAMTQYLYQWGFQWETAEKIAEEITPAVEYCITAGPGTLLDHGVTTVPMDFQSHVFTNVNDEGFSINGGMTKIQIRPTTTSCMTGK